MADECRKRENLNVTVVELLPHCLFLAFDEDLCTRAEEALMQAGVQLRTNAKAEAIRSDTRLKLIRELEALGVDWRSAVADDGHVNLVATKKKRLPKRKGLTIQVGDAKVSVVSIKKEPVPEGDD